MTGALDSFKEWPKATRNYVIELRNEMKKVTWPNSKQVQSTTIVVICTVFAFAAFFEIVDSAILHTITKFYEVMTR